MPVGELLGGALAGAFFQVVFGQLLSPEVWNYFRRRKMDEMLLKRLKMVLRSINAVSDDAEQKQYRDPFVKEWLNEVRDAVLDAEDLLDEIDFEVLKSSLEAESHTSASKAGFKSVVDG
ncbi:hypothetical protein VNO77_39339 [Canavalia gladiata]|uniref:Disease resistance N-terminal domain-containing protein n=1 Tax=Canavalia gladiata TaxID=3824 RepID=A0AAN9KD92_CANGL